MIGHFLLIVCLLIHTTASDADSEPKSGSIASDTSLSTQWQYFYYKVFNPDNTSNINSEDTQELSARKLKAQMSLFEGNQHFVDGQYAKADSAYEEGLKADSTNLKLLHNRAKTQCLLANYLQCTNVSLAGVTKLSLLEQSQEEGLTPEERIRDSLLKHIFHICSTAVRYDSSADCYEEQQTMFVASNVIRKKSEQV